MTSRRFHGLLNRAVFCFASLTCAVVANAAQPDDWEKILAKARQDGRVTLGTNLGIPEFRQGVTTAFSKKFGFPVELRVLEGAELIAVAGREGQRRRKFALAMQRESWLIQYPTSLRRQGSSARRACK
jgi:hypothetical protein